MDNSDKPRTDHSFTNGMAAALFIVVAAVGARVAWPHMEREGAEWCHQFKTEMARFNQFNLNH